MEVKTVQFQITPPMAFALDKLAGEGILTLEYDNTLEAQSYQRSCAGKDITLKAGDEAGMMYGILDIADAVRRNEEISDACVTPYMPNRGIKFNIPLDSRTPSYSDASTSASKNILNMWDMSFWEEFLDRMAENKYNVLSLWSLSPFPSLVKIPEYPEACVDDVKITTRPFHAELSGVGIYGEDHRRSLYTVKKITIEEKISFWQKVMEYAKDRCIKIYVFTWNLFVYGTEDSPYGITDKLDNPVARDYVYCGVKALMDTYPLLAGIGVTAGENMDFIGSSTDADSIYFQSDIEFIADTYGRGIRDYLADHPDRPFQLIHRMQMAKYDHIMNQFKDFPCDFEISFKYSQAHMYSSAKPNFIQGFLKEKSPDVKVWLTVRNDDYYMTRWGNPAFAKEYLANMPKECMSGFYMGPDGFTWGRDYMTKGDNEHPLVIDKMWYMFRIWGQLSYNIGLEEECFRNELAVRFHLDREQSQILYSAWKEASQIIPDLNCMHWHDFDFQWYPEGCCMYEKAPMDKICFADIHEFMKCPAMPYSEYASVSEYADSVVNGTGLEKISPAVMAESMENHANKAMQKLNELKASGDQELERTKYDIRAMSLLGTYYADKEKAAMCLAIYKKNGDKQKQKEAAELLKQAAGVWKRYSAMIGAMYEPQVLTRLCGKVNVQDFDELTELDVLLALED
ncbi:hypothetical protein GPL15_12710 [Clostridium sp. MCC353]|uniref:hypothetical protein n=1 Tax=Clostridium sp. MCC353 TaxID=2592646 RepID=UPI001C0215E9|nr:hypothetical protein [Clostridium sp. MCC353]MBT9777366.1 hypothetical protein [Clostridium sp. MCC353]